MARTVVAGNHLPSDVVGRWSCHSFLDACGMRGVVSVSGILRGTALCYVAREAVRGTSFAVWRHCLAMRWRDAMAWR